MTGEDIQTIVFLVLILAMAGVAACIISALIDEWRP